MFELNYVMLEKMGLTRINNNYWDALDNFDYTILTLLNDSEEGDNKVRYFFSSEERQLFFGLKEINQDPKLKKNKKYNEYKFIKVDFSKKKPKFVSKSCKSNIELLYLIRENLACDISYQRLFQINSIIK
jgi:formylmethanofuran dehydrogenase subunit E